MDGEGLLSLSSEASASSLEPLSLPLPFAPLEDAVAFGSPSSSVTLYSPSFAATGIVKLESALWSAAHLSGR